MARTSYVHPDIYDTAKPESWYMLGVYCSDGCVTKSKTGETGLTTQVSSCDEDWLVALQKRFFIESNVRKLSGCEGYVISLQHQELIKWLIAHGCFERKSLTIQMPDIPEHFLPDFFRGIVDGDGGVESQERKQPNGRIRTTARVRITSGSEIFIDQIRALFKKLALWKNTCKETKKNDKPSENSLVKSTDSIVYYATMNGSNAIEFMRWIYYKGFPKEICLRRKYETAVECFKKHEERRQHKLKNNIMNEKTIARCRELREKYTYGVISHIMKIPVQNFAPYVKDIVPSKPIALREFLATRRDGAMAHGGIVTPEMFFEEGASQKELMIKLVLKSHPLFSQWYFEHYPGSRGIYGRTINFLVYSFGKPIGIIGFSSMPKNFRLAKNYFDEIPDENILNNNIFRLVESEENIGTRVLAIARRELMPLYKAKYGFDLKGLITFVEPPRSGALYRADNWDYIGETEGKKRIARGFKSSSFTDTVPKHVFAFKIKTKVA